VPAPIEADTAPWWPLLAGREPTLPNVVARLPFLAMPNARARGISALVLARIEPEESGEDRALISVESSSGLSRNRIAGALPRRAAGLPRLWTRCRRRASLSARAAGRDRRRDPRLRALERPWRWSAAASPRSAPTPCRQRGPDRTFGRLP
jgi:hypothetical protein